jgi:magnesium transporter
MITSTALYVDGRPEAVSDPFTALRRAQQGTGAFLWMDVREPTFDDFDDIALVFAPHPLVIEDAVHAHQRPKLERFDDTVVMVLKTLQAGARGLESGEVMLFAGDGFILTISHGQYDVVAEARRRLDGRSEMVRQGPAMVLHAVCDVVVDSYEQITAQVEDALEELEGRVFAGEAVDATDIYALKRDVLELRHAVAPLGHPLRVLAEGSVPSVPSEARPYFRDVSDHLQRAAEKTDAVDSLLSDVLAASLARITVQQNEDMRRIAELGVQQNEDMRRISAWVAVVAVNAVIAGLYGMNFDYLPLLGAGYGYAVVLAVMVVTSVLLYRWFKRSGWL